MLTIQQAEKLNNNETTNQDVQLGSAIRSSVIHITVRVEEDASSGLNIDVPFDIEIIKTVVQARATSGGGTLTLRSGTTAITDAVVCAVDKAQTESSTIDYSVSTLSKGSTALNVIAANGTDRGLMVIIGIAV